MDILIETYQRLLKEIIPSYRRKFYEDFKLDSRLTGVVGARGVGKTTFLINFLRENYPATSQALYISADNLYFVENSLLETADRFIKEFDGRILCIDEIHKYKNWNQELKNIYDSYPKLKVIFSGSSSIDLIHGKYDLSRRVLLKNMFGFSFREYLEIQTKTTYPLFNLEEIVKNHLKIALNFSRIPKILGHFKDYLKKGYYPTFIELTNYGVYMDSLRNIIDKIIHEDIPSFYSLNTSNLDILKKIIYFFATSQPGTVNINRLAHSLKKDNTTISDYVQILKDSGLLRFLLNNKKGHAFVRNAEKIYLDNANLLYAINSEIGKIPFIGLTRELFVLYSLQNSGNQAFFTDEADFETGVYLLEIGGKSKKSNIDKSNKKGFTVKDDILIGNTKTISLYLFGFLS